MSNPLEGREEMEQGQDDGSQDRVCKLFFSSAVPEVKVGGLCSQEKEIPNPRRQFKQLKLS